MIGLSPNGMKIVVATQPVDFRRGMKAMLPWWRQPLRPISTVVTCSYSAPSDAITCAAFNGMALA